MTVDVGRLRAALERQRRELSAPHVAARPEAAVQQLLYQSAVDGAEDLGAAARRRLAELDGARFLKMATRFTTASGRRRVAPGTGWSTALALSADGTFALFGGQGPDLLHWDLAGDAVTVVGTERDRITGVALAGDGSAAVTGDHSGNVTLWRFDRPGVDQVPLCAHDEPVEAVAFCGPVAVSAVPGGTIRVTRLDGGDPVSLRLRGVTPLSVALSPDARHVVCGARNGQVWAWDLDDPEPRLLGQHDDHARVTGVAVHDGWAVSAAFDRSVRRWDLAGERPGVVVGRHHSSLHGVTLAGSHIVAGGVDGAVLAWPADAVEAGPVVLGSHDRSVSTVCGSSGGLVASTGKDGVLMRWRVAEAPAKRPPEIWEMVADRDGRSALSCGRDGVHRWGADSPHPVLVSSLFSRGVAPVAAGIVVIDGTGRLVLLGEEPVPLRTEHDRSVIRVAAASGDTVVTAEDDGNLYARPVPSGRGREIGVHGGAGCRALAVSPDGRWAVAPLDGTALYRWDIAGAADPVQIAPLCEPVRCLAISPDGRHVASGDVSGSVLLWRSDGGTPDGTGIGSHRDRSVVRALAFSRDGNLLVSAGDDGEVRAWTARPGARTGRLATKAMPHRAVALDGTFLLGSRHGGVTAIEVA